MDFCMDLGCIWDRFLMHFGLLFDVFKSAFLSGFSLEHASYLHRLCVGCCILAALPPAISTVAGTPLCGAQDKCIKRQINVLAFFN